MQTPDKNTSAVEAHSEIRQMVEENWRQFLSFAARGSNDMGAEVIKRFDEKNAKRAAAMSPSEGKRYLEQVEEERDRIFDEYSADPEGLKRRLGVASAGAGASARPSNRQGMGEMAVKTAVRASIWAAIWSLFR